MDYIDGCYRCINILFLFEKMKMNKHKFAFSLFLVFIAGILYLITHSVYAIIILIMTLISIIFCWETEKQWYQNQSSLN